MVQVFYNILQGVSALGKEPFNSPVAQIKEEGLGEDKSSASAALHPTRERPCPYPFPEGEGIF